jgi:hypothetical protein
MRLNSEQLESMDLAAALTEAQFRKAGEVAKRLLNRGEGDFSMIEGIARVMAANYNSVTTTMRAEA